MAANTASEPPTTYAAQRRPPQLLGIRRHRPRVVHDGPKPEHEQRRWDDQRAEREDAGPHVCALPGCAYDEEADEGDPEEDGVRRMDHREHKAGRGGRESEPQRGRADRLECECKCRRHEELARSGCGKREEHVGASHAWCEADHRDLGRGGHAGGPGPAEEGPAGLVGDHDGERGEDRREMHDHPLRVLSRELGDQGDEAVPEREGVSGMEAPVRKLGHTVE
jgi:hypothetical protein